MRLPTFCCWLGVFACALAAQADNIRVNGVEYTPLERVAGWLGMRALWVERGEKMRLTSQWSRVEFTLHKRAIDLNGIQVYLGHPVAARNGRLYISLADHEKTLQPALTPQIFPNPPRLYHIVLDPGHGGKDPGARNRALRLDEKNLTLDLARRLQRRLEARGYRVTLTRTTDTFLSLSERAAMANRLRADLFISLHCNAADATSVRGVETYAFTPRHQPSTARASLHASDNRDYPANRHDPWNLAVGLAIQRSLVDSTRAPDRGVKRGRWTVLQDLQMPGVLVECGFLTHSDEARNLGSTAYRDRLADAITDGVHAYQLTLNRIRGR